MRRDGATRRADNVRGNGREVFLEFGYPRWMVPVIGVMQGAVAVANFHDNGIRLLGGASCALCCALLQFLLLRSPSSGSFSH
jgi:hypothetical protein